MHASQVVTFVQHNHAGLRFRVASVRAPDRDSLAPPTKPCRQR